MKDYTQDDLFTRGEALVRRFCAANGLAVPAIRRHDVRGWRYPCCAFYRPSTIHICVELCAEIGFQGRAWSWPGHSIDRTPYGVLAHELGHHFDYHRGGTQPAGAWYSDFSRDLRHTADEAPVSNYLGPAGPDGREDPVSGCAEWFAEMFRLFVTNPDLLRQIRPRSFDLIAAAGLRPVVEDTWDIVLRDAPIRTIELCRRRIAEGPPPVKRESTGVQMSLL